jgi:branched-chain amino acid transport system substrate-binding protein
VNVAIKGRRVVITATALSAVLFATACGSSGSSSGTSSTTKIDLSVLGPEDRATGDPVKIGYVYVGQAQSQDNTNELTMVRATAQYVNEHLGGIAGRPVSIVECEDHLTPAGATDCANQMVTENVSAVLAGNPVNSAPIIRVLEPASIPFFVETAAEASLLLSTDASVMVNPISFLAAPIKVAKDDKVKKVAMVYVDIPAAAQLKAIGEPMYEKQGLELQTTGVPLGTPDVTPQIQAALSDGAQEFLIAGDTGLCVNSLKALKTLGFDGKVITNLNCLTGDSAKAIPGGFDGLLVLTTRVSDPSEPEVQLLHAVAAKYAPGTPTGEEGQAVHGYVTMLGFVRSMKDLPFGKVTPEGISTTLRAMTPQAVPLLPGQTFQCNRKVSNLTPAVCSNGAALVTLDESGDVTKSDVFNATPYL